MGGRLCPSGQTGSSLALASEAEQQHLALQGHNAELQAEMQRRQEEMEQWKEQVEAQQGALAKMRQQMEEMEEGKAAAVAEREQQLEAAMAGMEAKLQEQGRLPLFLSLISPPFHFSSHSRHFLPPFPMAGPLWNEWVHAIHYKCWASWESEHLLKM